jgi:putative membrane protein
MSKITDVRSVLAGLISFVLLLAVVFSVTVRADKMADEGPSPADLNDLEIAHVAYTADLIDIRYAHLALAKSKDPKVREFAQTMIRDHSAVNDQALALLKKLNANAQDNFLSKQLSAQADQLVDEMSSLSGKAFDQRYADNELAYHQSVNCLVGGTFIPNIENPELKALFEQALKIFKAHEQHAEKMVASLKGCE